MKADMHSQAWDDILREVRRLSNEQSQSYVARLLGKGRSTINNWLSGKRGGQRASLDEMLHYMTKLGIDPSPYFGGEDTQDDEYTRVPWLEATASMGGGSVETSKNVVAHLAFRTGWLRTKGRVGGMVVVNASGDSMGPTIPDRSVVLINEQDTTPVNNGVFFVCYGEDIYLKRLRVSKEGKVTHLISDSTGYAMPLEPDVYFEIIGRALWSAREI